MSENYDVVIIGAGIAGVSAALSLSDKLKILLISKGDQSNTSSYLAQGGIAASIDSINDSPMMHYKDTMVSGRNQNNAKAVLKMTQEAVDAIHFLESKGVHFDKDENNAYLLGLEGAHQVPRILRVGDYTGKAIMDALAKNLDTCDHILWRRELSFNQIESANSGGYNVICSGESTVKFHTKNIIMATGGIGSLFKRSTNMDGTDGLGIGIMAQAGIKLKDMGLIQFHPTVFYDSASQEKNERPKRAFLISEAVRGEGGILRNKKGEAFTKRYDVRGDLAPRDVVSKAIINEMKLTDSEHVWLDVTAYSADTLKERFPTIYGYCFRKGIDMSKDYIPVAPQMHYFMGGIEVDLEGKSNVNGIFAVGECACTGVHGMNRLASNSLLEAVVFARRSAQYINRVSDDRIFQGDFKNTFTRIKNDKSCADYNSVSFEALIDDFSKCVNVERDSDKMKALMVKLKNSKLTREDSAKALVMYKILENSIEIKLTCQEVI